MSTPFIYDRFVTSRNFIGRKNECFALTNLINSNENVVLYAPPKSGKRSLIQQVIFNMRLEGKSFTVSSLDMFNIRTSKDFLLKFGNTVIRSVVSTPLEYEEMVGQHLGGTHFVFDREKFANKDEVVSIDGELDVNDIKSLFSLPFRIARQTGERVIVVLEEFATILNYDDYEVILKTMEEVFREMKATPGIECTYVITGSKVNAMKFIFEYKRYFYRLIEKLTLYPLDEKEVIEHIRRGFLKVGKEINKEQALGACHLFKGNIWYLNHFSSICNTLAIGYINEGVMLDALNTLISIHEPRLLSTMGSLTDYQISFLKAVLDGVTQFSSAEMIAKYSLNSSANVKRVREALFKKEVVTNNDEGAIVFLDPLFEYWVRSRYFEMQ